jgi:hypothetical protein
MGDMTEMDRVIEAAKAEVLPFESWGRLAGESSLAYAAFCAFRDFGAERNVRKAVEAALAGKDGAERGAVERRYRMWRNWAGQFRWRERAADYDLYLDKLKLTEQRKIIENQSEVHRMVTGKMLQVVNKKLDMMDPAELSQGTVTEWVGAAIRAEREASNQGFVGLAASNGKGELKQVEINFNPEFEGL